MDPSWEAVALVAVNAAQVVLLAWIASRGARHRRADRTATVKQPDRSAEAVPTS